jgi:hypothetical protein
MLYTLLYYTGAEVEVGVEAEVGAEAGLELALDS